MNPIYERTVLLSDLLPYDLSCKKGKNLIAGLHEYRLLLSVTEQMIDAAQERRLEEFDANVGENMCQIRAIKIASTISSLLFSIQQIDPLRIQTLKQKTILLAQKLQKFPKGSLEQILDQQDLHLNLTSDEAFFIQARLVTLCKQVQADLPCAHAIMTHNPLQSLVKEVSKTFAIHILAKAKQDLSLSSVQFIQRCVNEETDAQTRERLSLPPISCEGRYSLPVFNVGEVLSQEVLRTHPPFMLYVNQQDETYSEVLESSVLHFIYQEGSYRHVPFEASAVHEPACIMEGIMVREEGPIPLSEMIRLLSSTDPLELLLMYSAAEAQELDATCEESTLQALATHRTFSKYRAQAEEQGCSSENSSLFFLKHMSCNVPNRFLLSVKQAIY